jgi:SAM-dependent methyltransferase
VRVLDAGCGRECVLVDIPEDAYVVGIDLDRDALALNSRVNEIIVGDVQSYPLPDQEFDAVVCVNVLEHLPDPKAALANMTRALKPGGTMSLGLPNLMSPKGLITKFTPLRFHVWVYRRFYKMQEAGSPGHPPYKAYHRWVIRPAGLRKLAPQLGLEVTSCEIYESGRIRELFDEHRLLNTIVKALWPGDPMLTECRMTLRRVGGGA